MIKVSLIFIFDIYTFHFYCVPQMDFTISSLATCHEGMNPAMMAAATRLRLLIARSEKVATRHTGPMGKSRGFFTK